MHPHGCCLHPDPGLLREVLCQPLQGPGARGQVQTARPPPHQLQHLVPVGRRHLGRRCARPYILQPRDPVRGIAFAPAADRRLALAHTGGDLPHPQLLLSGQQHHLRPRAQPPMVGGSLPRRYRLDLLSGQHRHV